MNSFAHTHHSQTPTHTHSVCRTIKSPKNNGPKVQILAGPPSHGVYLAKLISFELSTGNNAEIIHRHPGPDQNLRPMQSTLDSPTLVPNCLPVNSAHPHTIRKPFWGLFVDA